MVRWWWWKWVTLSRALPRSGPLCIAREATQANHRISPLLSKQVLWSIGHNACKSLDKEQPTMPPFNKYHLLLNNRSIRHYDHARQTRHEVDLHRGDDQIAPTGASGSIEHLQKWALLTASIPQGNHQRTKSAQRNDLETAQRIRQRYHIPETRESKVSTDGVSRHVPDTHHLQEEQSHHAPRSNIQTIDSGAGLKRRISRSPPPSITPRTGLSAVAQLREHKRRLHVNTHAHTHT